MKTKLIQMYFDTQEQAEDYCLDLQSKYKIVICYAVPLVSENGIYCFKIQDENL